MGLVFGTQGQVTPKRLTPVLVIDKFDEDLIKSPNCVENILPIIHLWELNVLVAMENISAPPSDVTNKF